MIKNISIENFKSIKNLNFEARRVNIFIGEPNTGKSNVLEALGLFSSIYVENLKDIIRFGYANNLFFLNSIKETVKVILDDRELLLGQGDFFHKTEGLRIYINEGENRLSKKGYSVEGNQIIKDETDLTSGNHNVKFFKFKVLDKYSSGKF